MGNGDIVSLCQVLWLVAPDLQSMPLSGHYFVISDQLQALLKRVSTRVMAHLLGLLAPAMEPNSNKLLAYNAQHYQESAHILEKIWNWFTYNSPVYKDHLAVCQIWPMPIFSWSKSSDSLCCNLGKHKNSIHAWMPRFDAKYLITEHLSSIVNPSSMIHQKDMFSFFPCSSTTNTMTKNCKSDVPLLLVCTLDEQFALQLKRILNDAFGHYGTAYHAEKIHWSQYSDFRWN